MKKFLITGASGFIGSNLIYKLEKKNNIEIIAVVHDKSNIWRLKNLSSKVRILECDLTDYKAVEKLIDSHKPEYIIHLATKGIYSYQWSEPAQVLTGNYSMAINLLEASKNNSKFIKGFVVVGSIFEYGNKQGTMKEMDATDIDLTGSYAVSKRSTSILADAYKKYIPVITLRLSTVYGRFNDPTKFIEGTILKILEKSLIKVAKGVVKDFVYIDDATDALILGALKAEKLRGEIINIGSGHGYKLEEVLEIIKEKMKRNIIGLQIEVDEKFQRANETKNWANIEKANQILGWKPKYSLSKGLDLMIGWYKENWQKLPKTTG